MILETIGLIISLRSKSSFSKYAASFFGLQLLSQVYATALSYLVKHYLIGVLNATTIGTLFSIPTLILGIASYGALILALKNIK